MITYERIIANDAAEVLDILEKAGQEDKFLCSVVSPAYSYRELYFATFPQCGSCSKEEGDDSGSSNG